MNDVSKTLAAGLTVAAAAGLIALGAVVRNRQDLGEPPIQGTRIAAEGLGTFVASNDKTGEVPEGDYFYEMSQLLKREYVEPITDPMKLATGAVRGMVGSLGDPHSIYMDKDEFRVYLAERQDKYEGIGAELALIMPDTPKQTSVHGVQPTAEPPDESMSYYPTYPKLTVVGIAPGGPADKAGVKLGDVVYSVDGKWVVNSGELNAYRKAHDLFEAKKMPLPEFDKLRKELQAKTERPLMALKAKDLLTVGTQGSVSAVWVRDGHKISTKMAKAPSTMTSPEAKDGALALRFNSQAVDTLKAALAGKSALTIDLRNNSLGDFEEMRKCLALVAPSGDYGAIDPDKKDAPFPVTVTHGAEHPPHLRLIVDRSTRGAAEAFALALSTKGIAKLTGDALGPDRVMEEVVELPDGSGYTLSRGVYVPTAQSSIVASRGR